MNYNAYDTKYLQPNKERKEQKVVPVCFLCNKVPKEGFCSGFFLRGIFVCNECEEELIKCKPEKEEEYYLTIAKLRRVLFQDGQLW